MRAVIFSFAALLASPALAATATSSAVGSTSSCAAEYIVDQCLTDTGNTKSNCALTDYSCLCAAYQAEVTCFNNCPGDARQATYSGLVTQYCALASQYSTTNAPSSTATPTSATSSGSAAATGTSTGTSTVASSKASASASSSANSAAADLAFNAGGLMVAIAGVMGVML